MHSLGASDAAWAEWGVPSLVSNATGLVLLGLAWITPVAARLLLALAFIAASAVNTRGALVAPGRYLDYAQWAVPPYRTFIEGPFAAHPAAWVLPIAAGQLACGLMLALGRRRLGRLGALGEMVFLLAIVPLGFGSGFPTPLVMALAAALLWRSMPDLSLSEQVRAVTRGLHLRRQTR